MQKLEAALGVLLFHRSSSRISLNATGKVAAQYAAKVLAAEEEMIQQTISFDRSLRTVSIGSCTVLPINLLMPVFQEQFKGIPLPRKLFRMISSSPSLSRQAKRGSRLSYSVCPLKFCSAGRTASSPAGKLCRRHRIFPAAGIMPHLHRRKGVLII